MDKKEFEQKLKDLFPGLKVQVNEDNDKYRIDFLYYYYTKNGSMAAQFSIEIEEIPEDPVDWLQSSRDESDINRASEIIQQFMVENLTGKKDSDIITK